MANTPKYQQRVSNRLDVSGGVQAGTSHLLRKQNEVAASNNAIYNAIIGSAKRRLGYEKVGETIQHGNDSLGAAVFRYGSNYKIMAGINSASGSEATVRYLDTAGYWTTIITGATPNTRFNMINDNNEMYIVGATKENVFIPMTNIDSSFTVSTSHNVYNAPRAKYIAEYNGQLYAMNCMIDGKHYPDRFYVSSPLVGYVTRVQTDQVGLLQQLRVDSVKYLKVGMVIDIYGGGSENKKVSSLTIISVDKKNDRISFSPTTINAADNDELWLTGTKGSLSRFWNTDYKTPETADYDKVPATKEAKPEFTGWGKNNNRLFFFTRNTFLKWDGANLITVSESVGCASHESIKNVGSWTIWAHDTGIWGYNDNTGQLKMLSRAIQRYTQAINQTKLQDSSGGVVGRVYKLAVGELMDLDVATTSTSTSSTSTSSTSSSTSSTSTSSTSTSSTSSSTSRTTTSTSTTSFSTSSTSSSISTSSTSQSTSTSSTSTTTTASTKSITRLCYDFDLNAWWVETHKREIRYQFNHTMFGQVQPYFTDDTGRLFRDEVTNTDNGDPIPMDIEFGRDNLGTNQLKNFSAVLVDSEDARGAIVQYSLDGGQFRTLGQVTENVQKLIFPQNDQLIEGRDINIKITHNDTGDPTVVNGISVYYSMKEFGISEV